MLICCALRVYAILLARRDMSSDATLEHADMLAPCFVNAIVTRVKMPWSICARTILDSARSDALAHQRRYFLLRHAQVCR